jgi:alcohol dehydrogenase
MPVPLISFDYCPRTRIVFGLNSIDRLGELARDIHAKRVLIVTDQGIVAAGHVAHAVTSLTTAGLQSIVFDQVHENPTTLDVNACLVVAKAESIDCIIGLGGGSSLDTAKGCNFLLTNGGRMQDYWGVGKATKPMLPLIAIPTTAGTGSECQSFALIADEDTQQKMACGDPKAAPCIAILDPALTVSQPRNVTACTGMDAVAHAVETAVSKRRNALSILYSREAFRLTINNFERVLQDPADLDARSAMLLGAAYAGIAIENSMLGAAHSMANPLTAHFGIVHGQAVGMVLPYVAVFNSESNGMRKTYAELAGVANLAESSDSDELAFGKLITANVRCLAAAEFGRNLKQFGVTLDAIPKLANDAAQQWTATFNPREVHSKDFELLYSEAL